ncbi:ankyrin repeat protein (macronuclear) [Tetrahymena thermophila SB210]|uniref:Ankyrin repeat protein n=1 Tax=Tetrahymena thermophila (strain SB210) TaxID=312017 RepID=Q22HE1_TETTS|nr:ankyrin repeat protein [Tetrahymena thermophila SB210]EAR84760.1 ankyrin repeat protein [Tetrahymena thermophila SB210]|eukprot:XP_001032423.1 ankyrin repeat protein [Tetrahymena thermophila SB210]
MNNLQGNIGARRISIKTQLSSNSVQQIQSTTPKSRENSQAQLQKQVSISNNTNMEGVITESDTCMNNLSNNQFIINSRHAAFMLDENISNPSSQNTITYQVNIFNQHLKGDGSFGGMLHNNNGGIQQLNLSQLSQNVQQNNVYSNAFKDKRLTPTMRKSNNEGNSFNYENNYFNQQKLKNAILKKGDYDDGGGGFYQNDPNSFRSTVREFENAEISRNCIDLQQMQLQRLPQLVQETKNSLQILNLSYNNFVIFPQELCQFLHLKIMKLDFNFLNEIPEQIAFLKYLEELSVSHNCLKMLPGTLQNMPNLRILNVGQNNITQIGQEITNIKKLEVLYIYNNEFTQLPAKLRNLIHLKELGLDWFRYNKPPIDTLLTRPAQNSLFAKLFDLCGQHALNAKPTISFKEFIKHFSLLDGAFDFTKVDARGRTIAFLATESEELGVLKALFDENKDIINQQDREGQTLLTQALVDNKVRSVQFLLDHGADPKKGGGHLGSCLHMATSKLNQELVLKFLALGVNPNATDFEGSTPLHIAFSIFQKDPLAAKVISEQLLSNGADPNILNKDLWTPLHLAVRRNQKDAIKYALQYNEKLRQKLVAQSPNNSSNNQNNLSCMQNEDDNSYYQDSRDSSKRAPSYNIKKDFIDENSALQDCDKLQIDSATPSRFTYMDKSNNSTPKVGSEEMNFQNRSQFYQDATTSFSKKSANFINRQEEDLSDENEDRSPGQTHRTANFNNQQSMKIAKNCKKLFKFDKRGGANKWTVMHLAANQGNIGMLEILSEANSCPYSLTKFNQTPRKVALQSLILFKILRKFENRWMLKNVLGEEYQSEFSARDNVVERNIQNLRGFIAETMKRKEHFLHEQLDLFDDKEFGYAIKENMQNNKAQNPRNKENGNDSEEDEILDPELSFDKVASSFKFNGLLAQQTSQQILAGSSDKTQLNNSMIPPNSGTLKPQQFGSIIRQNSKGSAQKFKDESSNKMKKDQEDDDDEDDDLMNDIDECDEDNDMDDFDEEPGKSKNTSNFNGASRNIVKISNNNDERSCVFMKNLPNANSIPNSSNPLLQMVLNFSEFKGNQQYMNASKQQEIEEQKKLIEKQENTLTVDFFSDIQSLEQEKFGMEVDRLKNHFLYANTIFQECLNTLFLLQVIHIRLSYKNMKFICEKGTLPRNIHIMNEFLHSKMGQQFMEEQKQFLPSILISFLHELLSRIKPLPELDLDQGTAYTQFNKIAQANKQNQLINMLILRTRDALCNLNCFDFINEYQQKCLYTYNLQSEKGDKDHIMAFSTSDYTNTTFLDYENMQSMYYVNNLKPIFTNSNAQGNNYACNQYHIVGSPNYYNSIKQQINSRQRKTQSQTGDKLKPSFNGNATQIKNSKQINQTQPQLFQQNQKQVLQDKNSKSISQPLENKQLNLQSNNVINTDLDSNFTKNQSFLINNQSQKINQNNQKSSKSFIQQDGHIECSSFSEISNTTNQNKKLPSQQQPIKNNFSNNYMYFSKLQNEEYKTINEDSASPKFIQLSQKIEEPKMPNELKKIDLNTFCNNNNSSNNNTQQNQQNQKVIQNIQQNMQQFQLQNQSALKQPTKINNVQISQNYQLNLDEMSKHTNEINSIKQNHLKTNDFQTISQTTINSQTQTKTGTSTQTSISFQESNKNKGNIKANCQGEYNQEYQSKKNTNLQKNQFQSNYQYQSEVPQKAQHYPNYDTSKSNYSQQSRYQTNTLQYQLNNQKNNDLSHSLQDYRKNQRFYTTKTGEENISDEDLSDDSQKIQTQQASKKYSEQKMQYSPFCKKV